MKLLTFIQLRGVEMVNADSDDYELMPSHELDDLRHEVSLLKRGSLTDWDKARVLVESMDRLTISLNRLITILDDAQKDIIDEYQESKPAEKLNQILEQNEMIAKALVAMSDNLAGSSGSNGGSYPSSNVQNAPTAQIPAPEPYAQFAPGVMSMPSKNAPSSNPRSMLPLPAQTMNAMPPMMNQNQFGMMPQMNQGMPQYNQMSQMNSPFNNQKMSMNPPMMSSMDDLPPMDEVPPLDAQTPPPGQKKKFLGLM